jgi:Gas vesicle protein K
VSPRKRARGKRASARGRASAPRPRRPSRLETGEVASLRAEVERRVSAAAPRWNADPDEVQRSVAKLVLTLVEFLRALMERQAIRRMEAGTLSPAEVERVGLALFRLEETLRDLAARFGLTPEDLNLDVGPLGRLL